MPGLRMLDSPDLAVALLRGAGSFAGADNFAGIREVPAEVAAAALAAYQGPMPDLAGPGIETLETGAADALASVSVKMNLELRALESVLLADRFRRRGERFRTATPEVAAILRKSPSIEAPFLTSDDGFSIAPASH